MSETVNEMIENATRFARVAGHVHGAEHGYNRGVRYLRQLEREARVSIAPLVWRDATARIEAAAIEGAKDGH